MAERAIERCAFGLRDVRAQEADVTKFAVIHCAQVSNCSALSAPPQVGHATSPQCGEH